MTPHSAARSPNTWTAAARTLDTPDAQLQLAIWCDRNGLKDQAIAHYQKCSDSIPEMSGLAAARLQKAGRAVGQARRAGRRAAGRRPPATGRQAVEIAAGAIRDGLDSKDRAGAAKAEQALAEVKDPRAVPMIWAVLLRGSEKSQLAAVTMLAEIDSRTASSALAALAVYSQSTVVRRRATDELKKRDLRDFVGKLIGLVQKPFEYEVKPLNGPGSTGPARPQARQVRNRLFLSIPRCRPLDAAAVLLIFGPVRSLQRPEPDDGLGGCGRVMVR